MFFVFLFISTLVSCVDEDLVKHDWTLHLMTVYTYSNREEKYSSESIVKDMSEVEMQVKYQTRYEYYDRPKLCIAYMYSWTKIR
jgi:hypothetical protein